MISYSFTTWNFIFFNDSKISSHNPNPTPHFLTHDICQSVFHLTITRFPSTLHSSINFMLVTSCCSSTLQVRKLRRNRIAKQGCDQGDLDGASALQNMCFKLEHSAIFLQRWIIHIALNIGFMAEHLFALIAPIQQMILCLLVNYLKH